MKEKIEKIFETHAHYDDEQFDKDRDDILDVLHRNGINKLVNISYDKNSIKNTINLTKKYDFIYGAVGYHPCDCADLTDDDFSELREKAKNDKIVAIGEIGLDYYWKDVSADVQKLWFKKQIELANELNKPIVIHSRDAAKDTLDIVKSIKCHGVMHCFSYSLDMAKEFVKLGFYIGVGGVVTFKNAKNIKEVVSNIDMSNIIIETDCPYLTPEPFRGKRNSSLYLTYVIDKIAELKNLSREEVIKITYDNAMKLYGIYEQ